MNLGDFHSWWTVALLVIFIGIVIWAWSGKRREEFEHAARIPLDDDQPLPSEAVRQVEQPTNGGKTNG